MRKKYRPMPPFTVDTILLEEIDRTRFRYRVALGVTTIGMVASFFLGRASASSPKTAIATPASKPLICVVPTEEDRNVTVNQPGTPRCVNHCDLTIAGDPQHMITFWTYASVPSYRIYIGQPCPVMPPAPTK